MIKFNLHSVTNGTDKARIHYSESTFRGRPTITLYSKDYDRALGRIFPECYDNQTDTMTDYFDRGSVRLDDAHPEYESARKAFLRQEEYRNAKWAKRNAA